MDIEKKRAALSAAVVVAALLGTAISGCSASPGSVSSTAAASSVTPTSAAPSATRSASATGSSASSPAGEEALPAALFEEDGMTLVEYTRRHPDADHLDPEKESVLEEAVGTGTQQITVDAQQGAVLRVIVLCPSDATGETEILTSRGGGGTKTWMAGSEALCGGWSAATPPVDEAGPMTFTVTVDNDKPFRMVLTAPSA
ncbi:hypothetical protein [Micrococcus sp. KBS0714]|uniref:hypothetical protein n=1 Tax=Micrococcus sp. KBS0714 TaxID=1179670 RepID=UPI001FEF51D6|nr:hypothetical protein [Micrococcus sp. KBS0714]